MSKPSHLRCSAICSGTSLKLKTEKSPTRNMKQHAASCELNEPRPKRHARGKLRGPTYMTQLTSDSDPSHFTSEKRVVAWRPAGASRRSPSSSTIGILTSNTALPVASSTPSISLMKAHGRGLRGQMRTGHNRQAWGGEEGNDPVTRTIVWLRGTGGGGGGG
jgi:hypothetical protein